MGSAASPAASALSARAWALVAIAIVAWACLPLLASRGAVDLLVFSGLFAIAGLGVAFLLGQCGIVSLAQSVFFGIGAYGTAYGTTVLGAPSMVCIGAGIGMSVALAFTIGQPVLRLSGYFLALATMALAIIGHVLFLEWEWLTGGTLGIGGIPKLSIVGFTLNTPQRFYYLVWPLALLLLWMHANLLRSPTGYAIRAMRDAPAAASVLAVPIATLKVKMFMLSAALGALAGSLYAHYVSFVSVDSFGVDRAVSFLLIAVLGGARTIYGPVLGALFVTILPFVLSRFGDAHALLFAVLLILAVIFLPEGFGGLLQRLWTRKSAGADGRRA